MMAALCVLFSLVSHTGMENSPDYSALVLQDAVFILRAVAMLLLLSWLLYLFTYRFLLSYTLVWIHVISTIAVAIAMAVLLFKKIMNSDAQPLQQLTETTAPLGNVWALLPALGALIFLTQIIYIVNLMLGMIKRMN